MHVEIYAKLGTLKYLTLLYVVPEKGSHSKENMNTFVLIT